MTPFKLIIEWTKKLGISNSDDIGLLINDVDKWENDAKIEDKATKVQKVYDKFASSIFFKLSYVFIYVIGFRYIKKALTDFDKSDDDIDFD